MCDLQPGDVVVCVANITKTQGWYGEKAPVKGQNYVVEDVFEKVSTGQILVVVSGAPAGVPPTGKKSGWKHDLFRRVYRPDGSLITKLLEPVELGERA